MMTYAITPPTARALHTLREVLCEPTPEPGPAPALALSDIDVDYLVDALHAIDSSAGYLHQWAQLDGAETSALSTIRETTAELLAAFGA